MGCVCHHCSTALIVTPPGQHLTVSLGSADPDLPALVILRATGKVLRMRFSDWNSSDVFLMLSLHSWVLRQVCNLFFVQCKKLDQIKQNVKYVKQMIVN